MAGIKSPRNQPQAEPTVIPTVDFVTPPLLPERSDTTRRIRMTQTRRPEEIRQRLQEYNPRGIEPIWWARVRENLIETVMAAGPTSAAMALMHINTLVIMASLAHMRGLPIKPVNLMSQEAWEQAKNTPALAHKSLKTRNDYQSYLTRMAHTHLPGEWPKRRDPQTYVKTRPPADPRDRERQYEAAKTFGDVYRADAEVFLDLAYFAFARPDEIRRATGEWISGQPRDVIVTIVDVSGRSRRVPVVGEPANRLLKRAHDVGTAHLVRPTTSRDRAHSVLTSRFAQANAELDLYAARRRGLVDLASTVPAPVLAAIGGLQRGSKSLIEIVADTPLPSLTEIRECVQRHQHTSAGRAAHRSQS